MSRTEHPRARSGAGALGALVPALARRGGIRLAVVALASLLIAPAWVGPAHAAGSEIVERPASGVFVVEGHGWGHGRGMSQWGAQGAASLGIGAEQIVSTYYPNTARAVLANAPIRVLVSDNGAATQVYAAAGLTVTDVSTGARMALPAGPTRWRAVPTASGLRLDGFRSGSWVPAASSTGTTYYAGPLRFSGPTFVRVVLPGGTSRDYRGAVQSVRVSATRVQTVVVLGLEEYLLGVVPRESSASWRPAALQAQSIAARSYSANKRARVGGRGSYDICDTTACQVFGGSAYYTASGSRIDLEPASTTAAVRATAGVVRTLGGAPILAEFSSSNGGWSTSGGVPYLQARRDDWDGAVPNPVHSWRATLPVADVERAFPSVGRLLRVRITARDGNGEWGGRVKAVVLEGVDSAGRPTSVSTSGAGMYRVRTFPGRSDGMRSTWFRLLQTAPAPAPRPAAPPASPRPAPSVPVTAPPPAALPSAPPATVPAASARLTAAYDGLPGPATPVAAGAAPAVFADGRTVVVPRSRSTTVRIVLRNTGSVPWPVGPSSPVQLGTSGARNRPSTSAGAGWVSPTRPARLLSAVGGGAEVSPGGSGVFEVVLHGNARSVGTTAEAFEPLWAGRGWIEGAARTLNVVRTDPAVPRLAELHAGPKPQLTVQGSDALVVRLRNYGGAPWQVGAERLQTDVPFPLATGWPAPGSPPALAANAIRTGARTVEPGEIGEWRVPVTTVGRPAGTWVLRLQAVSGGRAYGPVVVSTVTTGGRAASRPTSRRPVFKGSGPAAVAGGRG